jgi:ParB family chromosome partitioning protein
MTRRALGRGLEALIPTRPPGVEPGTSEGAATVATAATTATTTAATDPVHDAVPHEVDIDRIQPNRYQPRQHFDNAKLEELAESMRQHGVLQPVLVSPRDDGFELVAGERRLRAARLAGLSRVPVVVRDVDGREALKLALLENVQREDLSPIEEARGYQRLIDEFDMTQQDIAERLGKSRTAVANTLRLLQLPLEMQQRIQTGEMTAGHARALLGAATLEEQREIASLVRERGLSVRETEALANTRRETANKRAPAAAAVVTNPALQELARRLEERFGTRVRIVPRKTDGSSGRIEIEYYSPPELERIFAAAGVSYLL